MPDIMEQPNELATVSTSIEKAFNFNDLSERGREEDNGGGDVVDTDVPIYTPKGSSQKGRLVKNEDKEVRDRYAGATFEVRQFSLWKNDDMKAYADVMSEVGTDKYSKVVFQERVYIEEHQSWKVLIEIEHFCLVAR